MRILKTRLIMATLLPVFLVTATLAPIFWSNIQNRVEFSRIAAEALLEAESDVLLQDMNESLNHSLAIAEFPSVVGYLGDTQTTQSPYQETLVQQNRKQLGDMLNTLLTHFGRYTRLALIDAEGNERFSTEFKAPSGGSDPCRGTVFPRSYDTEGTQPLCHRSPSRARCDRP